MVIDIILCMSLLGLFWNKLFKMILLNREASDMSSNFSGAGSEWQEYGVEATSRQVIMIRTMTKQALLCAMAISSRLFIDLLILVDESIYHPVWDINFLFIIRKI